MNASLSHDSDFTLTSLGLKAKHHSELNANKSNDVKSGRVDDKCSMSQRVN